MREAVEHAQAGAQLRVNNVQVLLHKELVQMVHALIVLGLHIHIHIHTQVDARLLRIAALAGAHARGASVTQKLCPG